MIYASFSRLQADLNCVYDLINMNKQKRTKIKWKYMLNLASSEFPLKTNLQLVQILKIFNGANSIYIDTKYPLSGRTRNVWITDFKRKRVFRNGSTYPPAPHDIRTVKGSAYGIFERKFLENIFQNQKILDFIEWLKFTYSPDEM